MSFPIKRISQSNHNKGFIVSDVLFSCCNPKLSTIKGPLHFIFSCCSQTDFGWKNVFFLQREIDLEVVYLDEAVISCLWNSSTSKN